MPIYLTIDYESEERTLRLRFTKDRRPKSRYESVTFTKQDDGWTTGSGIHALRVRRTLNEIARREGWERAVFADADGSPTDDPPFSFTVTPEELTVSARLAPMKELDFRRTYEIGAPYKR
jgi:hypothetical protein